MQNNMNKTSAPVIGDEHVAMGERLRSLRKLKGLSIQTVAEKAGISRTYLGQVENGTANPSVGTIKLIANVLDVPLVALFDTGDQETTPLSENSGLAKRQEVRVIRKNHRKTIGFPNSKGTTFLLTPDLQRKMEVVLSTLPPGEGIADPYSHEGEEFGFVLEGTFEVNVAGEVFVLNEGDSIYFSSRLDHSTKVIGNSSATTLWVVTPPSF